MNNNARYNDPLVQDWTVPPRRQGPMPPSTNRSFMPSTSTSTADLAVAGDALDLRTAHHLSPAAAAPTFHFGSRPLPHRSIQAPAPNPFSLPILPALPARLAPATGSPSMGTPATATLTRRPVPRRRVNPLPARSSKAELGRTTSMHQPIEQAGPVAEGSTQAGGSASATLATTDANNGRRQAESGGNKRRPESSRQRGSQNKKQKADAATKPPNQWTFMSVQFSEDGQPTDVAIPQGQPEEPRQLPSPVVKAPRAIRPKPAVALPSGSPSLKTQTPSPNVTVDGASSQVALQHAPRKAEHSSLPVQPENAVNCAPRDTSVPVPSHRILSGSNILLHDVHEAEDTIFGEGTTITGSSTSNSPTLCEFDPVTPSSTAGNEGDADPAGASLSEKTTLFAKPVDDAPRDGTVSADVIPVSYDLDEALVESSQVGELERLTWLADDFFKAFNAAAPSSTAGNEGDADPAGASTLSEKMTVFAKPVDDAPRDGDKVSVDPIPAAYGFDEALVEYSEIGELERQTWLADDFYKAFNAADPYL
ncbi:uncharacterized protein C8Q71DRAFT_394228 [Rhodofomes roseus]|uniref:Uncharacterized protein n=1 Tax=Rhodofomes roseus TaxID=34475 RepID=A0ABQ8K0G5_9APHY|nr:uncharacterized protein C8Q71DRAFT_851997 [Rhodofomes roseus]XP_047773270.1 uncharacterized protein C8Q71DRAFT_394228 [Rhodofomes roseus]KAH9828591.1 hypothetical protein C8Q71DRAFT_851997 [Rhodofomes roseus]KAH9829907.1 hypothetical protein C8Q71DRAFT_394228 [Rhodofomes roseus]